MWGKREFIDSSSSSESLSTRPSVPTSQPAPSIVVPIKHIPKPPPTRPISANSRILSIQRAKLLNRGHESIRVETSPFYRNPFNTFPLPPDSKPPKPSETSKDVKIVKIEEIEEIKIDENLLFRERTPVKNFLRADSPERIDLSIVKKDKRENEITPEPRYQRVMMQANTVKERPASQVSYRRSQRDFKAVTTVAVRRGNSNTLSLSPDFKASSFQPVPLGSSLVLALHKVKDELNPKSLQFNFKIISTGLLIFTCKRRKSGNFVFSLSENDFSKKSEKFLGRVKVKKGKNLFKFYDYQKHGDRKHYGYLAYENTEFVVVVPKVENNVITDLRSELVTNTQVECGFGPSSIEKFVQKKVKPSGFLISKKNFVLTDDKNLGDYIKLEKTRKSQYKLQISSPFSLFQAACIAMTRFK